MRLDEAYLGQNIRLISFGDTHPTYRSRLLSFGLTLGTEALVVRRAPLGCPVQLEVRHTSITLRQDEACSLIWESI